MPNSTNVKNIVIQLIVAIDQIVDTQLFDLINHADLKNLEASWRSLYFLVDQEIFYAAPYIKIKLLTLSYNELNHDLLRAFEFDQSSLFNKIYTEEYDTPGGEPFGLLIGDYHFYHPRQTALLSEIAKISSSAFAPFITAIDPQFFELSCYNDLDPTHDLDRTLAQQQYQPWKTLQKTAEACFIAFTLPRILLRPHYETITSQPLWGNSSFAFANIVIQTFHATGWFNEMISQDFSTHEPITAEYYKDYLNKILHKPSIEVLLTENMQRKFSQLGFISLCENRYTQQVTFASLSSAHKSQYSSITHQLPYILCASRFIHTLKVMLRDKVGSFIQPSECEQFITAWINRYCADNTEVNPELKAKYPLRKAKVHVTPSRTNRERFQCTLYIQPHYPLDTIKAQLKLRTEI